MCVCVCENHSSGHTHTFSPAYSLLLGCRSLSPLFSILTCSSFLSFSLSLSVFITLSLFPQSHFFILSLHSSSLALSLPLTCSFLSLSLFLSVALLSLLSLSFSLSLPSVFHQYHPFMLSLQSIRAILPLSLSLFFSPSLG